MASGAAGHHRPDFGNAGLLGLETWPAAMQMAGEPIWAIDQAILAVFVVEIAARLYVYRLAFWRDP